MGLARNRQLTVTADGANNQTGWCTLKRGGVVSLEGTFSATVTLQRKGSDANIIDVTDNNGVLSTMTLPGTYNLNPNQVPGLYRLNCKPGDYTSGPFIMMIEAK